MPYSLVDLNYSDDPNAQYENEHLRYFTYNEKLNPTLRILNLSNPCQSTEQYIKLCNEIMEFCNGQLSYYASMLNMQMVVHLRLKVRLEEIKKKIAKDKMSFEDALKPYALTDDGKYQDLTLFKEREALVNKKTCEQLLSFISKKPESNNTFQTYASAMTVNWIVTWSSASNEQYAIFLVKLLIKELTVLYFKPNCLNWLTKRVNRGFLEHILAKENNLRQLYDKRILEQFFDMWLEKKPDLSILLLQNVKCLDTLAKIYPAEFLTFIKKLNSKDFFKLALQRGLEFQYCIGNLKQDFNSYRREITLILYEALSRGNLPLAKDIIELRNNHEIEQSKVKTVSSADSEFFSGTVSKTSVKTHQQVIKFRDSVAFNSPELLQYLQEKFAQTSQPDDQNLCPVEQSLYYIKHPLEFVQSLIKLELIDEGAVKEFTTHFCTILNMPQFEIPSNRPESKIDPNVLKIIEELQKQVQAVCAENIELKKELKEIKGRVDYLEAERRSSPTNISKPGCL